MCFSLFSAKCFKPFAVRNALTSGRSQRMTQLPSDRFVIALHSPIGVAETGLPVCPPEKMAAMPAFGVQRDTFSSPVSGRESRTCGIFERFPEEFSLVSLQPRLYGGASRIRTLGPFLYIPLRAAESATCLDFMLRNQRSEKGNCVGQMSKWSGFYGWPNGERVAMVWNQAMCLIKFETSKG